MRCWILPAILIITFSILAGWREWHWRALDAEAKQWEFAMRQAKADRIAESNATRGELDQLRLDHRALQDALESEQVRIEHRDTLVEMWQSRFRTVETSHDELQKKRNQLEGELRNERAQRITERRRQREQLAEQTAALESELALSRSALQSANERLQSYPFYHQKIALLAVAGNGRAFVIERQTVSNLPPNRRLLIFRDQQFIGTAQKAEQSPTHWLLHFLPDQTLRDALVKGDFLSIVWTTEL
jgi:hypothetical protein